MSTPFLIADAAEVAIMSPLAEAAFGSYDLQVPEGIDIEDIHDFEAPGNELGYVARLSPQRATGIARRFIRADVAVTAKDDTDPDVIPESDVDRVLSEAESRVESEFFLESDITKAGLGAWIPYADFNVGDIVNVRIFDIWVSLPVTRIEPIISEGDVVDWRVHVGGQLLSDDQAREVENATIQKELIQDRRDLAGIDAKATKAVKDSSEAKSTADNALQATENNRTYIDEQLEAAGVAVELGREYLARMQQHVASGVAQAGLATQFAAEANQYALRAEEILDGLDPLRDDVVDIHEQVRQLGEEAASLAVQAAQAATDAAAHVTAAEAAASAADAHAEAGKAHVAEALAAADRADAAVLRGEQHVTAADDAAEAARSSAAQAVELVSDADNILDSTRAARDDAQASLDSARGLLNEVPGDGRSLAEILAQVVQLHQETLESHSDILDAHAEVLEKHGQAIIFAATAASRASMAAQYAMEAAQEALKAAREAAEAARQAGLAADDALKTGQDAAEAARQAGLAADDAAEAARLNGEAIGKLAQADEKLGEADAKLQAQIDILEESQRLLAKAVQALAAGVAQASMAAQSANLAAENAGKSAGSALDAAEANTQAIDTLADTVEARDAAIEAWQAADELAESEQNDLFDQLRESQQDIVSRMNGQLNQIIATKAGTTWPGVNTFVTSTGYWGVNLPDSNNSIIHVQWWKMGANGALTPVLEKTASPAPSFGLEAQDNEMIKAVWGTVAAAQVTITKTQAAITVGTSTTVLPSLTHSATKRATQGYLRAKVTWNAANRGSTYRIMIFVNGVEVARQSTTSLGPLSFLGNGERTQTVTASGVTVPAGASVEVRAYCSNSGSSQRRIKSASLDGTWIESQ